MLYNSFGQPVSITDPSGSTSQLAYDGGDLTGITDPLGRSVTDFTDAVGRVVSAMNPLGGVTRFAYNPLNRVTSVTHPRSNQTSFVWDPTATFRVLPMPTLTQPTSRTTTWTGSQPAIHPLLAQESYQYDLSGNLTVHRPAEKVLGPTQESDEVGILRGFL